MAKLTMQVRKQPSVKLEMSKVSSMVQLDPEEKSMISTDPNNDLKLGSDNKLLSQPTDTDFLAYYILAKG